MRTILAGVLVLGMAITGCASLQAKRSVSILREGWELEKMATVPAPNVDPVLLEQFRREYERHLDELKKELGANE